MLQFLRKVHKQSPINWSGCSTPLMYFPLTNCKKWTILMHHGNTIKMCLVGNQQNWKAFLETLWLSYIWFRQNVALLMKIVIPSKSVFYEELKLESFPFKLDLLHSFPTFKKWLCLDCCQWNWMPSHLSGCFENLHH